MTEKINLLHGILRFDLFWMCADLLLLQHFFWMWWQNYRKTGRTIDFWYFTLFMSVVLPSLFSYPFNNSYLNLFTCKVFAKIEPFIEQAFAITLLGYISIWCGSFLFMKQSNAASSFFFLEPLMTGIEKNIRSKKTILGISSAAILLWFVILFFQIKEDCLFSPRSFFLKTEHLRPLFNLTTTVTSTAIILAGLHWQETSCRWIKRVFFLIFGLSIALGVRGISIGSAFIVLTYVFFKNSKTLRLFTLLKWGTILLLIAFYLDDVRCGNYNPIPSLQNFFLHLCYGNHISDTRDFAWVLAYWDSQYIYGKSYVAGFFSFIPRALSSFREEWSFGCYSNALIGFNTTEHAGLRTGLFGEMFFNFGPVGVALFGLLLGYTLRYSDQAIKHSIDTNHSIIQGYAKTLPYFLASQLCFSTSFWALHFFCASHLILAFCRLFVPAPITTFKTLSTHRREFQY